MVKRSGELIERLVGVIGEVGGVVPDGSTGGLAEVRNALEDAIGELRAAEDCARVSMMDLLGRLQETTQVARAYQTFRLEPAEELA